MEYYLPGDELLGGSISRSCRSRQGEKHRDGNYHRNENNDMLPSSPSRLGSALLMLLADGNVDNFAAKREFRSRVGVRAVDVPRISHPNDTTGYPFGPHY